MKSKLWLCGWLVMSLLMLGVIGGWVYKVDPYFHYHEPNTDMYYYTLDNQRSQNNGITRHFKYDALVTGTSMTENFKTTEVDEIFGVKSVKVPYSGATYKEINDNLTVALKANPKLKVIIRGLDLAKIMDHKDLIREDLGEYPSHLYDSNPFNDVKYLYSKDIIFNRVFRMVLANDDPDFRAGITPFDSYSRWQGNYTFGVNAVCPEGLVVEAAEEEKHLTEEEKEILRGNIVQNVTTLAEKHPEVEFYYFLTPYSIVWWNERMNDGTIYKQLEAEQYMIELILECENIRLYSFNNRTDITTDLNNYKDASHYAEWINSIMLEWMHDGEGLLTKDNYKTYLAEEYDFYTTYNYESIREQVDYEEDYYAAALLREEMFGNKPLNKEYAGAEFNVEDIEKYEYLNFWGKKVSEHSQPTVCLYDVEGNLLEEIKISHSDMDNEWHQYLIKLPDVKGAVTIIFNDSCAYEIGYLKSDYIIKDIMLY